MTSSNLRKNDYNVAKSNLKVEISIIPTTPTNNALPVITNIKGAMLMTKQIMKPKENINYERNQRTYSIK